MKAIELEINDTFTLPGSDVVYKLVKRTKDGFIRYQDPETGAIVLAGGNTDVNPTSEAEKEFDPEHDKRAPQPMRSGPHPTPRHAPRQTKDKDAKESRSKDTGSDND